MCQNHYYGIELIFPQSANHAWRLLADTRSGQDSKKERDHADSLRPRPKLTSVALPPCAKHPFPTSGLLAPFFLLLRVRGQLRDVEPGHVVCDISRIACGQVRQDDHRQLVLHVAVDARVEPLRGAFVFDDGMTVNRLQKPPESVIAGIWFAIFQFCD